jgi:hypothetical protein
MNCQVWSASFYLPGALCSSNKTFLNCFSDSHYRSAFFPIMADSNQAFYVTSVSNGLILANQPNSRPSGVVAAHCGDKSEGEKWIVEAGDKPNVVALKNASNGQYLHAEGGRNGSKAGTGDKQWWTISRDRVLAPGACSLSPVDYPNVFLNHFQGRPVPKGHVGMTVHMWQWEVCVLVRYRTVL